MNARGVHFIFERMTNNMMITHRLGTLLGTITFLLKEIAILSIFPSPESRRNHFDIKQPVKKNMVKAVGISVM